MKTAFDQMGHAELFSAAKLRSGDVRTELLVRRELHNVKASVVLPGTDESDAFAFNRGGKQGGPNTPEEWNLMLEYWLAPLFHSWALRGMGINLEGSILTHAIWADTFVTFSPSWEVFRQQSE